VVATAAIITDLVLGMILDIHGTDLADHITVNQNIENGALVYKVHTDSWAIDQTYAAAGVKLIRMHMCAGDDEATISSGVDLGAIIYGEGGNDHLNAGKQATIVVGGDGDDMLIGGNGNDILIGGGGVDRIVGNAGEDILISGRTSFDADDATLIALRAAWNSNGSVASRVVAVQNPSTMYHLITDGNATPPKPCFPT